MTATTHAPPALRQSAPTPERARALAKVFLREELQRERLAFRARAASLFVIAVWLTALMPREDVVFYLALLGLFVLIGYGHYWVTANCPHRAWSRLALIALDFGLLAFATLADNPLNEWTMPPPLRLETGNFAYFFVILVSVGLSYSAWRAIASGVCGALAWTVGVIWIAAQPGSITAFDLEIADVHAWVAIHGDPNFVDTDVLIQNVIVFGIVTGILALSVRRSRRLVLEQVQVARERANLARYFPPSMVDSLAGRDEPLGAVRTQKVAVLFADLVGFTQWAERRSAGEVIGLLREVHARLEACVFEHDGTLDKFLGDGLMATFGTPVRGPRDAANAIACARAMQAAIDAWNASEPGREPIRLSIGVQYGEVVMGDIGSERRMEFTVLGDTVNVASRLEAATREYGCRVLIGDAALAAARAELGEGADILPTEATAHAGIAVKGHTAITAWGLSAA